MDVILSTDNTAGKFEYSIQPSIAPFKNYGAYRFRTSRGLVTLTFDLLKLEVARLIILVVRNICIKRELAATSHSSIMVGMTQTDQQI